MSAGGSVFIPLVAGLHVNEGLCLVCVPRTLSLYLHKLGSRVTPAAAVAGVRSSAANRLIGEVVQSRRRPQIGPSPG